MKHRLKHMCLPSVLLTMVVEPRSKPKRESMISLFSKISYIWIKPQALPGVRRWCPPNLHRLQNHQKTLLGSLSDNHLQGRLFPPLSTPLLMMMNLQVYHLPLLRGHNHQGHGHHLVHHLDQRKETLLSLMTERLCLGFHTLGSDVVVGDSLLIPSFVWSLLMFDLMYSVSDEWKMFYFLVLIPCKSSTNIIRVPAKC